MVGGDGTYFLIVFWYFQFDKLQNLKHTFPCKVPTDHPHFPISFFFPLSRIYPVITHYKASECPAPVSFIFECHCFEHTIFQKAIGFPVLIKVIILVSEIKEKSLKSSVQWIRGIHTNLSFFVFFGFYTKRDRMCTYHAHSHCTTNTRSILSISFTISCNIKITHFFGEFISRHISKSNRIISIIGGIRHFHCSTTHTHAHIYTHIWTVLSCNYIAGTHTHIFERYFNKELKQRIICFWLLGGGQMATCNNDAHFYN